MTNKDTRWIKRKREREYPYIAHLYTNIPIGGKRIITVTITISPLVILANSILLILSSAAIIIAITTLRALILAGTILLAIEFIIVQYSELALYTSLASSVSTAAAILGIQVHGSHMTVGTLAGIIILVVGSTSSIEDGILENIVLYWHLIEAVWFSLLVLMFNY